MQVPLTHADRIYFALAAVGGVAYVYRFATPIGNLSLFRLAIPIGVMLLIVRWAKWGVDRAALRVLPFFCAAAFGPVLDFLRLEEDSPHRVELLGYFINLAGMTVMFSAVASRAAFLEATRWFCYAAAASIPLAWYAWATGEIPGEGLLRRFGSEYGRELSYLNVSEDIARLTGTFFDPNFFGAYLVMTIAVCLTLWSAEHRRRWLLIAAASSVSMLATTSRTALLGLVALAIVSGERGLRGVGRRVLVLLAVLAIALPLAGAVWEGFYERLLNTDLTRLEFLARGWSAFASGPLFGGGAAGMEDPETGHATAHMLYLSALGKYGLVGGGLLLCFVFAPLLTVLCFENVDRLSRRFVLAVMLPLAAMYLTYDFFLFLEFQFLLLAIVYAVVFRGISIGGTTSVDHSEAELVAMPALTAPVRAAR